VHVRLTRIVLHERKKSALSGAHLTMFRTSETSTDPLGPTTDHTGFSPCEGSEQHGTQRTLACAEGMSRQRTIALATLWESDQPIPVCARTKRAMVCFCFLIVICDPLFLLCLSFDPTVKCFFEFLLFRLPTYVFGKNNASRPC